MIKKMETCRVLRQDRLADGICSLWLQTENIAGEAKAGQFVSLYSGDASRLLPRPISICEIDRDQGLLRLVYRVAGRGTEEFSRLQTGDSIRVMGPLGNGFPLERARGKRVLLMGGGIGVPPMVETARELDAEKTVVAGFRDVLFLNEELAAEAALFIATEDGSAGVRGNVLDVVRQCRLEADVIFACGPAPMLRAIKTYAREKGIECWISMEERMACGIGACLACVCRTVETDEHSQVHNRRICKDGPVFLSTEVEL